jgi:hypothetical protein
MSDISNRFEQLIIASQRKLVDSDRIMPIAVPLGIKVGSVMITSNGSLKTLYRDNYAAYSNVSLNLVTIRLANLLAKSQRLGLQQAMYQADQIYGKWLTNCQHLHHSINNARCSGDFEKLDILQAKYIESKQKADITKKIALRLSRS